MKTTETMKAKAKLKVYAGENKRRNPFTTGYRPMFEFVPNKRTTGQITLLNQQELKPGEEGIVEIKFITRELLGEDFDVGEKGYFYEAKEPLGEAEIIEIIHDN